MTRNISSRQRLTSTVRNAVNYISDLGHSDEVNREISGEVKIIHATAGRVRMRVSKSDRPVFPELSTSLQQLDGVTEVAANEQTSSLVVKFDENKLSLPQMLALLEQMGIGEHHSASVSQLDPFAPWKSIDFWKEQGISFIPLFAGLGVTGALGVSGWVSIPVYLVTANATRKAIDYFELDAQEKTAAPQTIHSGESKSATNRHTTPVKTVQKSTSVASHSSEAKTNNVTVPAKITYTVVHAIPGRIRFNIPKLAQDRAYARRLERMLKTDSQVKSVRLNCNAASVAIAYKQSHIPLSHWVGIMLLADQPVPAQAAKTTEPTIKSVSQETETQQSTPSVDISRVWDSYKAPAIAVLLDMMANLSLDASGKEKVEVGNGS